MMTFNRGIGQMWYCGGFIGQHIFYHTQKQKQKIHARAAFQIQMSITTDLVDVFLQDPFLLLFRLVAQLGEHTTDNREVNGSNPFKPTNIAEWSKGDDDQL